MGSFCIFMSSFHDIYIYLSILLIYLSYLSILLIYLSYLSIYLIYVSNLIYLSIFLSIYLSFFLSIYLSNNIYIYIYKYTVTLVIGVRIPFITVIWAITVSRWGWVKSYEIAIGESPSLHVPRVPGF